MNKALQSFLFLISSFGAFSQDTAKADDKIIFETVEKEAEFPGGTAAWINFLQKNLNPNVPVDNGAPVGKYTVYVQFVVARDGTIRDIVPLTRLGFGMENEVVQLLKKSGNWIPAWQHGRTVNAYRKQPVTFLVTQEGLNITTETPFVLYSGRDNEIRIRVDEVKGEDLKVVIPKGSITRTGSSTFIVNVKGTGRALLLVSGKKGRPIATVSFEIRDKE